MVRSDLITFHLRERERERERVFTVRNLETDWSRVKHHQDNGRTGREGGRAGSSDTLQYIQYSPSHLPLD